MREISPTPEDRFIDSDRLDRIRNALPDANLDGVLAFSPANSYYLAGVYAGMYSRPVAALVTSDRSAFLGPYLEHRKANRTAWVDNGQFYEDVDDPFDLIASVVTNANVETLGIDQGYARPSWISAVSERLDTELVDATELLLTLRKQKTDWEVDMICRTSQLATAGIEVFIDNVAAGRPELAVVNEMQNAYYETYLDAHSEYDIGTANELGQYGFASALSGAHALEPHSISSAKTIQNGESVVGISLPALQGYLCEEERTVLVGNVPSYIEEAMETLVDIRRRTMNRLHAGRSAAEVDEWTANELRKAGYGENLIHRTGHGEGITIHEGPAMNAAAPEGDLLPGMVVSVEPGLYFEEEGFTLRHSDTIVITENDIKRLTTSDDGVLYA